MNLIDFKTKLNSWGQEKVPFLFMVDFEMLNPLAWKLEELSATTLMYSINGRSNAELKSVNKKINLVKHPVAFEVYEQKFSTVSQHLNYGNSFLTNLTCKTKISINLTLEEMFYLSSARYKFCFPDNFVAFSPEIFIKINSEGVITSYPMKGTIDASIPDASNKILSDKKEMAEHITIVDLIRNDLSIVASNVHVPKFRYIEEIKTHEKKLLQVSSVVEGLLRADWPATIGDIITALLPAGSISGAPKPATLEILKGVEGESRGYYTGIAGIFDGEALDSGVLIRFIEKSGDDYFYRSGGGITTQSDCKNEYQEMIDKVYVPID